MRGVTGAASDGFTQWDMSKWQMDDFVRGFAIGGIGAGLGAATGFGLGVAGGAIFGSADLIATGMFWATVGSGVTGLSSSMAGAFDIYSHDGVGFRNFVSDSTWSIFNTAIGDLWMLLHLGCMSGSETKGKNAFILKGWTFMGYGGTTWGNTVVINHEKVYNTSSSMYKNLLKHELRHVWQARKFGPGYTIGVGIWITEMAVLSIPYGITSILSGTANFIATGTWADPHAIWKKMLMHSYMNTPWEIDAHTYAGNYHASYYKYTWIGNEWFNWWRYQ